MTVSFHKYGDLFFPGTGDIKVNFDQQRSWIILCISFLHLAFCREKKNGCVMQAVRFTLISVHFCILIVWHLHVFYPAHVICKLKLTCLCLVIWNTETEEIIAHFNCLTMKIINMWWTQSIIRKNLYFPKIKFDVLLILIYSSHYDLLKLGRNQRADGYIYYFSKSVRLE